MLPMPKNYAIWPGVVPADLPVQMTIAPCERAFMLFEGEEYNLTLIAVNADEPSYYVPTARRKMTVTAHGGCLRFECTFEDEQEHLIILEKGETQLGEMFVYSLRSDLYGLRPMKGDLHSHSYRSDGKRDPAALAGHYREQGYDFFALTDHNRFYPGGEIDEAYAGVQTGIVRIPGEEVHAPGSVVHIVHVGGKSGVTAQYVNDPENFEREAAEYLAKVPADVPARYAERYAKALWATDRIHEDGGIAIFPHPYWKPGGSKVHNVCDEFARILIMSGMFDAYELIGGMGQIGNNRSVALWGDLRAEGLKISVVGSSDVHTLEKAYSFPHYFTICFAKDKQAGSVAEAVKAGLSVAVEAVGDEYARQYRCYGALRLVSYAQFLLTHYFPQQQRACQGEGVAMRAYAMGEADAALIEVQAAHTESLRARFFGEEPAVVPSDGIIAFENKWREVHLQGPLTKGSGLSAPPVTRQI